MELKLFNAAILDITIINYILEVNAILAEGGFLWPGAFLKGKLAAFVV